MALTLASAPVRFARMRMLRPVLAFLRVLDLDSVNNVNGYGVPLLLG